MEKGFKKMEVKMNKIQDCTKGYIIKQCKTCEHWQDNAEGVGCTKSMIEDECSDFAKAWIEQRPGEIQMFKNRPGSEYFEVKKF